MSLSGQVQTLHEFRFVFLQKYVAYERSTICAHTLSSIDSSFKSKIGKYDTKMYTHPFLFKAFPKYKLQFPEFLFYTLCVINTTSPGYVLHISVLKRSGIHTVLALGR